MDYDAGGGEEEIACVVLGMVLVFDAMRRIGGRGKGKGKGKERREKGR